MQYLFSVVQTLVVVLEHGVALLLAGSVLAVGVDDVAGEHLLPEGKAAAGTCEADRVSQLVRLVVRELCLECIRIMREQVVIQWYTRVCIGKETEER